MSGSRWTTRRTGSGTSRRCSPWCTSRTGCTPLSTRLRSIPGRNGEMPHVREEEHMSARIAGLGHIGIYVQDLDRMAAFYRDFMGMTLTKTSDVMAFFSSDPERSDHEIALMTGRRSLEDPHLIQQISLRVETLDDLRDFYRRLKAAGYEIGSLVRPCTPIACA